jgi:hypothetical protein
MSGVGIDEIVTFAKDALAPVGGTLSDIWAGLIGDKVAGWRLKNIMATQKAVFEEARKAGLAINTSKIPERYAVGWFEEAAKQDEPEIQALFARLLLRASEGDRNALDRRHISTLSQFTPIDAAVFDSLFNPKKQEGSWNPPVLALPRWNHEATVRDLARTYGEAAGSSAEHLVNLGVLARGFQLEQRHHARRGLVFGEENNTTLSIKNELIATALGWSLHLALKPPPSE